MSMSFRPSWITVMLRPLNFLATLPPMSGLLPGVGGLARSETLETVLREYKADRALAFSQAYSRPGHPLHPLEIVRELADVITPDVTTCLDMGTFHIWLARYMMSFRPARC
jgi:acetolactate synthase-1/2/3 large subunit